ncbi:ATP-binding protein [Anaerofustis butyriciformans]|uniref:ATP-binding protein n=1 Tax=Anaerofustis butyriciformans TaxID=3108533 RepID=UPI002E34DCCF|nr:ATP-binding protein [Anaerofustis sp. HA2171]
MQHTLKGLNEKLDSLAVFRNILNTDVIKNLRILLDTILEYEDDESMVFVYSEFVSCLYNYDFDFSKYIFNFILNDENFYIKAKAAGKNVPDFIENCVDEELNILDDLSKLTPIEIKEFISYDGFLPAWENTMLDLKEKYKEKVNSLTVTGYGMYAKYTAFVLDDDKIVPVKYPDSQRLEDLFGYERERDLIIKNTKALLDGTGASNMLLYGDAGTGKSSSVKAVCNHFKNDGLRLLEIKKNQLYKIPNIVDELAANPLKFVIFIDDLSFTGNDDNFSALKAILEGGVSALGNNVAIYATSNRRHLVKETMSERQGDELHRNDTLQETMSLSARFGLTITFQKPDKKAYLNIVENLAKQYGVEMDLDELFTKAEAFSIRHGGRSARTAKQFVELVKIGI